MNLDDMRRLDALKTYKELEDAKAEIERLRKANLQLREGCEELQQRIKRLEQAGDEMLNAWLMPEDSMEYCDCIALSADAKAKWFKAKEAKL